jgi:hypothetical protein
MSSLTEFNASVNSFDGSRVIYVVERNGMYPTWNKAAWRVMSRVDFAQHVDREVLCRRQPMPMPDIPKLPPRR